MLFVVVEHTIKGSYSLGYKLSTAVPAYFIERGQCIVLTKAA